MKYYLKCAGRKDTDNYCYYFNTLLKWQNDKNQASQYSLQRARTILEQGRKTFYWQRTKIFPI